MFDLVLLIMYIRLLVYGVTMNCVQFKDCEVIYVQEI